jgi:YrbI family 3-deoxy-D-manno-octulosonate 8-phosphate phosphatase
MKAIVNRYPKVIVTDVDGCLTDDCFYYLENGDTARKFNVKDGYGVKLLGHIGIEIWALSGEASEAVIRRLRKLGFDEIFLGIDVKLIFLEKVLEKRKLEWNDIYYLGNDFNDIAVGLKCGGFWCPNDAHEIIKTSATVLSKNGGEGVLREMVESILGEEEVESMYRELYG